MLSLRFKNTGLSLDRVTSPEALLKEPAAQVIQLPADEPPHPARYDPAEQARHALHVVEPTAQQSRWISRVEKRVYGTMATAICQQQPISQDRQARMRDRLVTDIRSNLAAWHDTT